MPAYLGSRTRTGTLDPSNPVLAGGWTVRFDPAVIKIQDAEVYHIAIQGPGTSQFQVWVDTTFYDNVVRGDINSWDPSQPMAITRGQTLYFYWNSTANPRPIVTIFLRTIAPF